MCVCVYILYIYIYDICGFDIFIAVYIIDVRIYIYYIYSCEFYTF